MKVIETIIDPEYYVKMDGYFYDRMNGSACEKPDAKEYTTTKEYIFLNAIDGMNHPMLVVCDMDGTNIRTISSKNCKIAL